MMLELIISAVVAWSVPSPRWIFGSFSPREELLGGGRRAANGATPCAGSAFVSIPEASPSSAGSCFINVAKPVLPQDVRGCR